MKADTNARISLRTPLTAAALSLLIVACGGGGSDGGSRNVSASPSPGSTGTSGAGSTAGATTNVVITPGTTGAIADAIAGGTPSSTGVGTSGSTNTSSATGSTNGGNTTGTGSAAGSNTSSSTGTTPTTPTLVPLVSNQGVRGDVVLAMMDQRACNQDIPTMQRTTSVLDTNAPELEQDTPWVGVTTFFSSDAYIHDMDKWKIDGRHPPAHAPSHIYQCAYPDIRSYSNPVRPGHRTFSMHTYPAYLYFNGPPINHPSAREFGKITKGLNTVNVQYQVSISADQFSIGGEAEILQEEDFDYRTIETPDHKVPEGARRFNNILGGVARVYGRQALVPFGALNQWQDGAGNHLQLLLIKADEPNTIRLCTHFNGVLAKRLYCVTWEVPNDWTWGQELLGGTRYLIDDRSVYRNESGFMYWRTNGDATGARVTRYPPQAG